VVVKLYEYDGKFFTPRGSRRFHTAFDGLQLLKSLGDSVIDTFFKGNETRFAIRWLMDELHKHRWVAKRRRMNWEESRTLGLLTQEALQELICVHEGRGQIIEVPRPLSTEEQAFFKFLEDDIRTQDSPL
jgi:hypothetical protein